MPWAGRGAPLTATELQPSLQQAHRPPALALKGLILAFILFSVCGCNNNLPDPDLSSTPVATPIIVTGEPVSPSPSEDPKPKDHLVDRVGTTITAARESFPGRTGVVFVDLESGAELKFGEEAKFESASLMKLIVLAELHREFQVGTKNPTDKIVLEKHHQVGGSGELKAAKLGTSYTLEELAKKMITQSDNTATQMLTDLIGRETLTKSAKVLGLPNTTIERDIYDFAAIDKGKDNYLTARDAGFFLKLLAKDELPGSAKMHEVLEQQKRNDMIGSAMSEGVRIAHKTGELNGILHDAGIIYAPRGAYILVMLSDEVTDKARAKNIWSQLAQDVFTIYNESSPTPTPAFEP